MSLIGDNDTPFDKLPEIKMPEMKLPESLETLTGRVKEDWNTFWAMLKKTFNIPKMPWETEPTVIVEPKMAPLPTTKPDFLKVTMAAKKQKALEKAGVDPVTAKAATQPTTKITKVPLLTTAQQKKIPRATLQDVYPYRRAFPGRRPRRSPLYECIGDELI